MAHVGDELRLVLARNLKLAALLRDLLEEAGIFERNRGLVGEGLHEADDGLRELARLTTPQDERAKRLLRTEQWYDKRCAEPCFQNRGPQRFARALTQIRNLQWLSLRNRFA